MRDEFDASVLESLGSEMTVSELFDDEESDTLLPKFDLYVDNDTEDH
jgi:hypothetical protein